MTLPHPRDHNPDIGPANAAIHKAAMTLRNRRDAPGSHRLSVHAERSEYPGYGVEHVYDLTAEDADDLIDVLSGDPAVIKLGLNGGVVYERPPQEFVLDTGISRVLRVYSDGAGVYLRLTDSTSKVNRSIQARLSKDQARQLGEALIEHADG